MKNKGFTLIEVMIALAVFSIGIMSIMGMLMIGEKGITAGDKSLAAVLTARGQMELLRSSVLPDTLSEACTTIIKLSIQCVWSVKKGSPAEGLATVEVMATWYEGERKRELILTTLRFDDEK